MRKYAPWLAVAGIILAGAGCAGTSSLETDVTAPKPAADAKGRAVFTITDEAVGLADVTAVNLTLNKVEAHSAAQGWVNVSSAVRKYDLLELKRTDSAALLADVMLAADTYDQVRLGVSKVELTVNGKVQEAKLPSTELKIVGNLTVTAGQTSTAALDFMIDKSLHLTGNGKYILTPVVRLLTKNAVSVKVDADEKVKVEGGETESDEVEGMDEKGEMKADFELKKDLDIDADGRVKIRVP